MVAVLAYLFEFLMPILGLLCLVTLIAGVLIGPPGLPRRKTVAPAQQRCAPFNDSDMRAANR